MDKKILAVIPARGGSVGIPLKNILPIAGRPLITYTISESLKSTYVNRIIVSTDNREIAKVSQDAKAEVVWRPHNISGNEAKSEDAILHVLNFLFDEEGYKPDIIVFLQCTSPLMISDDIDGTIKALIDNKADSALSVTDFHYFLWRKSDDGSMTGINHDKNIRKLRQNKIMDYLETGAVYAMRYQGFMENKHRFFGKTVSYVMPPERCLEIDEPVDLDIAEVLINKQQQTKIIAELPDTIDAVVFDFDGVFTDNNVIIDQNGNESVICNRSDGMGLSRLKNMGLNLMVISSEKNSLVKERCDKLGISCMYGLKDKRQSLQTWIDDNRFNLNNIIYLGNDVNDIGCMQAVVYSFTVADAHPKTKRVARYILTAKGGRGAVRQLCDLIERKIFEDKNA